MVCFRMIDWDEPEVYTFPIVFYQLVSMSQRTTEGDLFTKYRFTGFCLVLDLVCKKF